MDIFTLDKAREKGFEPNDYSYHPPVGGMTAYLDFMAWNGSSQTLYFRDKSNSARYCLRLIFAAEPGMMTPYTMNAFFPYVKRGDLCHFVIFQNDLGAFCLSSATILDQKPLCTWSEQCDQRSPYCVFRN